MKYLAKFPAIFLFGVIAAVIIHASLLLRDTAAGFSVEGL